MSFTSEQVHWFLGAAVTALALLLLLYETEILRSRALRYLVGSAAVAVGIEAIFDRFVHGEAAPGNYLPETLQHLGQGVVFLAVGIIEILRTTGRLGRPVWGLAFPVGLALVGLIFLFHAQHDAPGPLALLVVQHRIFGVTLLVAAGAKALAELAGERARGFRVAWLVVALLAGLELLLYSEDGDRRTSTPATHGSH